MNDPRHLQLANLLVSHSCRIGPGERVLISGTDVPSEVLETLVAKVYEAGGYPSVDYSTERIKRALLKGATPESLGSIADWEKTRMGQMDAYIGIRGYANPKETSDLPEEANKLYMQYLFDPVHRGIRVPDTKWVVLRYPTPSMALMAGMSTEAFEEFYYRVTTGVDYAGMELAMKPAAAFLETCDKVRIEGPGTDLSFSVKSVPVVPCFGRRNIPDGEVYTAPVKDSVNGILSVNTKTTYFGFTFENIRLEFKDGRIADATANDAKRLNKVLDTDPGARFIGEFALGCNPHITEPFDETLFDEKIAGSFHFTPGSAYDTADNGNRSAIHWDMVTIQRSEYGGGTIRMDDVLVRENGLFVHEAFSGLNPDRLGKNSP